MRDIAMLSAPQNPLGVDGQILTLKNASHARRAIKQVQCGERVERGGGEEEIIKVQCRWITTVNTSRYLYGTWLWQRRVGPCPLLRRVPKHMRTRPHTAGGTLGLTVGPIAPLLYYSYTLY